MNLTVHVYLHPADEGATRRLDEILARLSTLVKDQATMAKTLEQFRADLSARVSKLSDDVEAQTTVDAGAATLLDGLTAAIKALREQVAAAQSGGDLSVLDDVLVAFDAELAAAEASKDKLRAAVVANTENA